MKGSESELFNLIKTKGEGLYDSIHIYSIESGDADESFRTDCGQLGSFEVHRYLGGEEYNLTTDEWEYIQGINYMFMSCDEQCDDYPKITIEQAIKLIEL